MVGLGWGEYVRERANKLRVDGNAAQQVNPPDLSGSNVIGCVPVRCDQREYSTNLVDMIYFRYIVKSRLCSCTGQI